MDTKQQTAVMERRFWKRLCALNRFSFFVLAGGVARAADKAGNWVEAHSAQEIVDDAECEVSALKQRIADLEARLEVDARHAYDGIACRDATIAELQAGYDAARLKIESLQKAATDRHALQATGAHPAPCARYCEAQAFYITMRNLQAEIERLRTCNKDAQHEIANLQESMSKTATDLLRESYDDVIQGTIPDPDDPWHGYPWFENTRAALTAPAQPVAVERIGTMFFPSSPEHSILGILLSTMSDQLKIDGPTMRDALLWYCGVQEIATTPQPAAPAQAGELITIRKPSTRAEIEWLAKLAHLLIGDVNNTLDGLLATDSTAAPVDADVQQDAERYHWLRDNRSWQVLHRIRPGKSIEYRMREDGDWWGSWWPTYEQAIDAARASQEYK